MKTIDELKEFLDEMPLEGAAYFTNPGFVSAIVGSTQDGRLVYDYEKMIEAYMEEEGGVYEEAVEWIDYNTLRTIPYMGDQAPIVFFPIQF